MVEKTNKSAPKDVTPPKWDGPEDARTVKGAGVYPNYNTIRTRSGHVLTFDDSEDHESITMQHRSGSMVQFMPDGAVQFVAQNGQYTFVFGENRVKITGAYDVTVQGAASLRVKGDYNTTVMGNHNMTVNGDFNMQAKNFNSQVRGDFNLNAKNFAGHIEGSSVLSSHGTTAILADGGLALTSTSQGVGIKAATDVGIKAVGGKMMLQSAGDMSTKPGGKMLVQSGAATSIKAGGNIDMDGTNINLNSGTSQEADDASLVIPTPQDPNPTFGGPK